MWPWRQSGLSGLERAQQRRDRARAQAQRKTARQTERAKKRCAEQIRFLEDLRGWASRYNVWFNNYSSEGKQYYTLIIHQRTSEYRILFYTDGEIAVQHLSHFGLGYASSQLRGDEPHLWNWLRQIPTTELLRAANAAGYMRGAGLNTAG